MNCAESKIHYLVGVCTESQMNSNMTVETVRNFFGGHNFKNGKSVGIHLEPGPDGGLVMLDDTTVLEKALQILRETEEKVTQEA